MLCLRRLCSTDSLLSVDPLFGGNTDDDDDMFAAPVSKISPKPKMEQEPSDIFSQAPEADRKSVEEEKSLKVIPNDLQFTLSVLVIKTSGCDIS